MEEGFQYVPVAPNCGFRTFDVFRSGGLRRVATDELLPRDLVAPPAFQVHSVVRRANEDEGHTIYDIELGVGGELLMHKLRESELRKNLRDVVKSSMDTATYARFALGHKFPDKVRPFGVQDPAMFIQDYLEQLAVAMADDKFPVSTATFVNGFLLGGLLEDRGGDSD